MSSGVQQRRQVSRLAEIISQPYVPEALIFVVTLLVLLLTMAPTVYELDSAELATGAALLGIVHAPGYPLYTFIAHLFTLLPIGDIAFRVNLFSAVCLSLSAVALYRCIDVLIGKRRLAAVSALTFIWSYYVWSSGIITEIYAPQMLTLALVGWSLAKMYRDPNHAGALRTGFLYGVAVAMAQSSVFFAPGLLVSFLVMRIPLKRSTVAGLASALIVVISLLYFPLRYQASPEFNKLGEYDGNGVFHSFDFRTPQGVLEAVSAEQFRPLFFSDGFLPTPYRLGLTAGWFWTNFLGVGLLLGLLGAYTMFKRERGLFICWLAIFGPYTYFYLCYGATDRDTMFGPSYLVWTVALAYGLQRVTQIVPRLARSNLLYGLPLLALIINFPAVNLSKDTAVRDNARAVLQSLPPNAVVGGYWADVAPLQYIHFVEKERPDVTIYDLFLFKPDTFHNYMDVLGKTGKRPIVFVTNAALTYVFGTDYTVTPILINLQDQRDPFKLVFVAAPPPNHVLIYNAVAHN